MTTANAFLIRYGGGWAERDDATSISAHGRREALLGLGSVQSLAEAHRVADGQLAEFRNGSVQLTAQVAPVGGDDPYIDWFEGDTLTVDGIGASRVLGITMTEDADGTVSVVPTMGDVILPPQARLMQAVKKMVNGTVRGASKVAQPVVPIAQPRQVAAVQPTALGPSGLYVTFYKADGHRGVRRVDPTDGTTLAEYISPGTQRRYSQPIIIGGALYVRYANYAIIGGEAGWLRFDDVTGLTGPTDVPFTGVGAGNFIDSTADLEQTARESVDTDGENGYFLISDAGNIKLVAFAPTGGLRVSEWTLGANDWPTTRWRAWCFDRTRAGIYMIDRVNPTKINHAPLGGSFTTIATSGTADNFWQVEIDRSAGDLWAWAQHDYGGGDFAATEYVLEQIDPSDGSLVHTYRIDTTDFTADRAADNVVRSLAIKSPTVLANLYLGDNVSSETVELHDAAWAATIGAADATLAQYAWKLGVDAAVINTATILTGMLWA